MKSGFCMLFEVSALNKLSSFYSFIFGFPNLSTLPFVVVVVVVVVESIRPV